MTGTIDHMHRWGPIAAIMICIGLGAAIWITPATPTALPEPVQSGSIDRLQSHLSALEDGAEELRQRPLFHLTRRPVVAPEPAVTETAPLTLTLTGIVNSDDVQIALLRLSDSPLLVRRQVGERAGPWLVTAITPTAVTVVSDDGQETVIFLSPNNP